MGKDINLVNIYLKIHHKQQLSLEDLRYLAEYDPECFEKTCRNVVYNIPEAKSIMEEGIIESKEVKIDKEETAQKPKKFLNQDYIEKILENIRRMEFHDFPKVDIDANRVKGLLGSLYMELLFPHNDKNSFLDTLPQERKSSFDKKA